MSATLLAVIIALAIGHLAPGIANGLRQFGWFRSWLQWLNAQFPEGSLWRSPWGIALALLVPLVLAGLLQVALDQPLWGFVGLLFDIVVLFWCWGPRDLDLDVAAILDAPDATSRRATAARLYPHGVDPQLDGASLVEAVFRNAQRRWFGVLFWFCVLGPFGALLYRLSVLAAEQDADIMPPGTLQGARSWLSLLEWPVTQLIALGLALVGNFDSVPSARRPAGAFGGGVRKGGAGATPGPRTTRPAALARRGRRSGEKWRVPRKVMALNYGPAARKGREGGGLRGH